MKGILIIAVILISGFVAFSRMMVQTANSADEQPEVKPKWKKYKAADGNTYYKPKGEYAGKEWK